MCCRPAIRGVQPQGAAEEKGRLADQWTLSSRLEAQGERGGGGGGGRCLGWWWGGGGGGAMGDTGRKERKKEKEGDGRNHGRS